MGRKGGRGGGRRVGGGRTQPLSVGCLVERQRERERSSIRGGGVQTKGSLWHRQQCCDSNSSMGSGLCTGPVPHFLTLAHTVAPPAVRAQLAPPPIHAHASFSPAPAAVRLPHAGGQINDTGALSGQNGKLTVNDCQVRVWEGAAAAAEYLPKEDILLLLQTIRERKLVASSRNRTSMQVQLMCM